MIKEKDLYRVTIEKATTPFDGALVMTNRYWTVIDNCILFYGKHKTPQCNSNEHLVRHTNSRIYPGADTVFIPVVYVEHNCFDVC